jgi:hypothetical protein
MTAARLASVSDAIDALVSGRVAEYTIGERRFTYLKLGELREMEKDLRAQLAAEQAGGMRVRLARFPSGF